MVRRHTATVASLTEVQAAYLAGLVDGEGSILIAKAREGRNTWRLTISSTYRPVLEWCLLTIGAGSIVRANRYNPKHATAYWWQCYSWNAKAVLEQLLPYMLIKREKAKQMIQELDRIGTRAHALMLTAGS